MSIGDCQPTTGPFMSTLDFLGGLNEPQRTAVVAADGPLLVLAGAGSGKTRTLVHRLAYLIAVRKVPASSVLAVTFTNKAAQAMRTRVGELLRRPLNATIGPLVGTFHAVSCRFLRREAKHLGYPAGFSIYDEDDQKSLVKQALRDLGYGTKRVPPGAVLAAISRAKADLMGPQDYARDVAQDFFTELVARVYVKYQELLRHNKALDFDDLIGETVRLWQEYPEVLERYQRTFRYLLVDEYQDVNRAQYVWTQLLAQKYRNLCVVGDDWQSIYGWRGADFGNILRFEQDYPEAKVIKLEQNYRSTKVIVQASNAVMAHAELKADKILWTENVEGEPISVVEVEDEVAEARFVMAEVSRLVASPSDRPAAPDDGEVEFTREEEIGVLDRILPSYMQVKRYQGSREALKMFAVLYRTNAQSRALEEVCLRAGLPYQLVGAVRFYERREVKDVLAYLRLIANPADGASFERAVLSSPRGVGLSTIEQVLKLAQDKQLPILEAAEAIELQLKPAQQEALLSFTKLIRRLNRELSQLTVAELIGTAVAQGGLVEHLRDGTSSGEARLENIEELKTVAEGRSPGKGREPLIKFLTDVSLWQDQDSFDEKKGGLTLMTAHAAKGLEFDTVFIVGMEEGLFPHTSSLDDPRQLEEERRLAYVALTRARTRATLVYAVNRRLFGKLSPGIPSRFIAELPPETVSMQVQSPF